MQCVFELPLNVLCRESCEQFAKTVCKVASVDAAPPANLNGHLLTIGGLQATQLVMQLGQQLHMSPALMTLAAEAARIAGRSQLSCKVVWCMC